MPPTAYEWGGGHFGFDEQNAFLRDGLTEKLETDSYTVLNHKSVPANDGGLALGQAVIAANLQAPSTFDD